VPSQSRLPYGRAPVAGLNSHPYITPAAILSVPSLMAAYAPQDEGQIPAGEALEDGQIVPVPVSSVPSSQQLGTAGASAYRSALRGGVHSAPSRRVPATGGLLARFDMGHEFWRSSQSLDESSTESDTDAERRRYRHQSGGSLTSSYDSTGLMQRPISAHQQQQYAVAQYTQPHPVYGSVPYEFGTSATAAQPVDRQVFSSAPPASSGASFMMTSTQQGMLSQEQRIAFSAQAYSPSRGMRTLSAASGNRTAGFRDPSPEELRQQHHHHHAAHAGASMGAVGADRTGTTPEPRPATPPSPFLPVMTVSGPSASVPFLYQPSMQFMPPAAASAATPAPLPPLFGGSATVGAGSTVLSAAAMDGGVSAVPEAPRSPKRSKNV